MKQRTVLPNTNHKRTSLLLRLSTRAHTLSLCLSHTHTPIFIALSVEFRIFRQHLLQRSKTHIPKKRIYPLYKTKNKSGSEAPIQWNHSFVIVTSSSTLIRIIDTCYGPINVKNRSDNISNAVLTILIHWLLKNNIASMKCLSVEN